MKRPITFVSIFCSVLFLAAIIVFASGIYIDKKDGTARADARYQELLTQTKENFSENSYGSSEFSINFIRAIGEINDFSSLKLEINGTLVYSYPPSTFSLPSPDLIKSYSDTVYIDGKNFTLRASIYLMTPGSIYNHSRFAFLLILVGTLIVGLFIVFTNSGDSSSEDAYSSHQKKKPEYKAYKEFIENKEKEKAETEPNEATSSTKNEETVSEQEKESEKPAESGFEEVSVIDFDTPAETKPIFNPEPEAEKAAEKTETENNIAEPAAQEDDDGGLDIIDQMEQENLALTDEDFFGEDKSDKNEADSENDEPVFTPLDEESFTDFTEPAVIEPVSAEQKELEPSSTLSPVTNIALQASLEPKLDEEIKTNPQTTVSLIKINGLDRGNAISEKIIAILKEKLNSDLLFEYKADSYAVISKENLQAVVDNFEELYNKITDFLRDNNAANEVSVGISSASGRNVNAERILLEAGQALEYASQDMDSPIVAFRANPDKYKEYIESSN